jgi:exodeoxyribonuclease-3
MRIATWNVNSLGARLERVEGWIARAAPDVLLLQETKLADDAAPHSLFEKLGYRFAHHGQGRWNGVAIASKVGLEGVVTRFGDPAPEALTLESEDEADPFREARMISAVCGGVRVVSVYVPNGRSLESPHYQAKLRWLARLSRWVEEGARPDDALLIGGDFNVAPADLDVWDPAKVNGGTHVSEAERRAVDRLLDWGLVDLYRAHHPEGERFSWWDYRAGMFHKNYGMRIDLILGTRPLAERLVWSEIDREARKGKPTPSDHAPVVVDLDAPGLPFDAGWQSAAERFEKRRKK